MKPYQRHHSSFNLHVLPTGTYLNFSKPDLNGYIRDWMRNQTEFETNCFYIFKKHVNTKNPAYSVIFSSGNLHLVLGSVYNLFHDQTGSLMCTAELVIVVTGKEIMEKTGNGSLNKSLSMMVFK